MLRAGVVTAPVGGGVGRGVGGGDGAATSLLRGKQSLSCELTLHLHPTDKHLHLK